MRRTWSRHAGRSPVSGQTAPNRNGLVVGSVTSPPGSGFWRLDSRRSVKSSPRSTLSGGPSTPSGAGSYLVQVEAALRLIARPLGCDAELVPRLAEATQPLQEGRAHRGELGVSHELALLLELVRECESALRPLRHAHGDGAVEGDDGRRQQVLQHGVERGDPAPVGALDAGRTRVAGGDRRLQRVRARTER